MADDGRKNGAWATPFGRWVVLIAIALGTGLAAGLFRYRMGFFVLGHAIFTSLTVTWLAGRLLLVRHPFGMWQGLFVVLAILAGELIGLGLSQPRFDPTDWLLRILGGEAAEPLFGIAAVGGALGRAFYLGVDGGFWVLFNLIDLLFLFLFTMFGLNTFVFRESR